MSIAAGIVGALNTVMSAWLLLMLVYTILVSFFGYRRKTRDYAEHDPELRFLVLVPAHNEESVIAGIIQNLQSMDYPRALYDFYIIADNCTDGTAEAARRLGARVIEKHRESPDAPTGKPIALQYALRQLGAYHQKYDLVMFFDADNLMDTSMLREVNSQLLDNPDADIVQCYLGSKNKSGLVALFYYVSYTITNRFFQYAKHRMGLNCVIGGTGFAVRAEYLYKRGGWTAMSLTEDFELQIEATAEGQRILWNNNVRVYDEKPTRLRASLRQRTRWAQGHWHVALKNTPRVFRALFSRRISFWEFLSTFLYMYSVSTYLIVVLQLFCSALLLVFQWCGLLAAQTAPRPFREELFVNLPGLCIFAYTFLFCFFLADRWDNGVRFNFVTLVKVLVSMIVSNILVCAAQVIGFCKRRNQRTWVKTEHAITPGQEECLSGDSVVPDARHPRRSHTAFKASAESDGAYTSAGKH